MTLNIKTDFDKQQERNDKEVAQAYCQALEQARKQNIRKVSATRIIKALADTKALPYKSPAGIRSSLIRSNIYTSR